MTIRGIAAVLVILLAAAQAQARAAWKPSVRGPFDIQLTSPFQLTRKAAMVALGAVETSPTRLQDLQSRGVRTVCVINAGAWENWRPDSGAFDKRLVGAPLAGWPAERWLDIRALDALGPVLARRLDLCRDKGFDGVLLRNLDGYRHRSGFPLTANEQVAYNRMVAKAARERGLVVGLMNTGDLAADLVDSFDYAVAEGCFEDRDCADYLPFRRADKPVFVVEYTNLQRKMDSYCVEAAQLDVQLVFKAQSLNGKLHRRCP
ncbi:MAG: endo alpha-1,4 polygalactosaminidase [Geminicoccaceae bacterium]